MNLKCKTDLPRLRKSQKMGHFSRAQLECEDKSHDYVVKEYKTIDDRQRSIADKIPNPCAFHRLC